MEFNSPPVLPFIGNPFPLNDLSTLQGLVGRLCEEIGFATNVEVHDVKSGSKYNIILFTCLMTSYGAWPLTQRNYCVLRTSKVKHHASNWKDVEMGRLAAFHTYSLMPMPVPLLFAWDMTYDNCIQCSYIIQEQVHGQNLSEHYLRLNTIHNNDLRLEADEAEDYATLGLTLSAVIEHQEQAYHFSHYGTLQLGAGMVLKSSGVNGIIDRIPLHVKPFMQGGIAMRTNTKVIDFILELLNGQETQVRTALHENKYRKILDIALCLKNLEDENHPAHRAEPSILWHPNFHPRKIMVTQRRIFADDLMVPLSTTFRAPHSTGGYSGWIPSILGWDGALALPRIMTRCPPSFLWEMCPQISAEGRDKMIKVRFDTSIERKLPGYCADAYGEMEKIIRAVGMYAILGFDIAWEELSFEGLVVAWEKHVAGEMIVQRGRWHRGKYLWGR